MEADMTQPVSTNAINADVRTLVEGNTAFALDLYQQLRQEEGNLFFSPYSISTALAMTYGGARGKTEAEMAHVLHFDLGQEKLHLAYAALEAHFAQIQDKGESYVGYGLGCGVGGGKSGKFARSYSVVTARPSNGQSSLFLFENSRFNSGQIASSRKKALAMTEKWG
jgi:hypothetical protein